MRLSPLLLASVFGVILAVPATAMDQGPSPAAAPVGAPVAIDPMRLLPPPPAEGSALQKAEIAELHRIQRARTPAELARAAWDSEHETPSGAYQATLGPKFDLAALPATSRVLDEVLREQSAAKKLGKGEFHRPRPWIVDPTLVGCDHSDDKPNSSYPSGHATMAFSVGVVLADLMPDRAQAILARAGDYARNRLVCGVHFPSDIAAGQALGTAVAVEVLHEAAFQPDLEAARAELRSAGL
jgi:acid phosphatase (class A)